MDGKLLFCVSVGQGDNLLYGPEWKEAERGISLVDLFLQVCGSKVLGQQVQVLVSRDREFLEGAVVQVCSPLSHLAERSQSYIKFIIKGGQQLPSNAFTNNPGTFTDNGRETGVNNGNYKTSPDRMSALCDPLMSEKWRIKNDANMLHTLAAKPTFENMTVEEICDEIRNIRKTELNKTKLNTWTADEITKKPGGDKLGEWDEKPKDGNDVKNKTNPDVKEEINKREAAPTPPPTEKSKRPSPVPKSTLSKSSPKSSPVPPGKKKTEVKRSTSFRTNKSFKRHSENTRNKLNHGKKHTDRNVKDKATPTRNNNKSTTSTGTSAKTSTTNNNNNNNNNSNNNNNNNNNAALTSSTKCISDRLSILAQPRKRHSEPNIPTSPTLHHTSTSATPTTSTSTKSLSSSSSSSSASTTLVKRSNEIKSSLEKKFTSSERLNRRSRDSSANSTFIKGSDNNNDKEMSNNNNNNNNSNNNNNNNSSSNSGKTPRSGFKPKTVNSNSGKKKSCQDSSDDYFVQIYAKDKPDTRTNNRRSSSGNQSANQSTNHPANPSNNHSNNHSSSIREPLKYNPKQSYLDKSKSTDTSKNNNNNNNTSQTTKQCSSFNFKNKTKSPSSEVIPKEDYSIPQCISPVKRTCASPMKQTNRSYELHPLTPSSRVLSVDNLLASINADANISKRRHESLNIDDKDIDTFEADIDKLILSGYPPSPSVDSKTVELNKSVEVLSPDKEKEIASISHEILHNSVGNSSIENIIDTYLAPNPLVASPAKSSSGGLGTKSPLFSQLLEKNNLKSSTNGGRTSHSNSTTDSSMDELGDISADSKDTPTPITTTVTPKVQEPGESRIPTKGFSLGFPTRESIAEKRQNLSLGGKLWELSSHNSSYSSSDNDTEKTSKIPKIPTIGNKKLSPKSSPEKNRLDGTPGDKMWANSRGIKFMKESMEKSGSNHGNQSLHLSDLDTDEKPSSNYSPSSSPYKHSIAIGGGGTSSSSTQGERGKHRSPLKKSLDLKLSRSPDTTGDEKSPYMRFPLSLFNSTSTPTSSSTSKGITSRDSPSTSAVVVAGRSPGKSSSSGASTPDRNRKLWGNSIDGMDTMLIPSLQAFSLELRSLSETVTGNLTSLYENFQRRYGGADIPGITGPKRAFTPTSPRHQENGGDQQGVAIVFRNLRKIEGQMRSIEHATITMLKVLNEKSQTKTSSDALTTIVVDTITSNNTSNASSGGASSGASSGGNSSGGNITGGRSVCWSELKNACSSSSTPGSGTNNISISGAGVCSNSPTRTSSTSKSSSASSSPGKSVSATACGSVSKNSNCAGGSHLLYWMSEHDRSKESNSESVKSVS